MTGGRIRRVRRYIGDETFCLTYGDGVTDLDIRKLIAFHQEQDTLVTLTAVQPPGRFGAFKLDGEQNKVFSFREKPKGDGAWINGGFFVMEPEAIDYIEDIEYSNRVSINAHSFTAGVFAETEYHLSRKVPLYK